MAKKLYKQKLYERLFEGFLEEKEIPTDDKGIFVMLRGLNIVEMEIGPFADFNISIEEQERMWITSEVFENLFRDVDCKKEKLLSEWKALAMSYICEVKHFSKRSKECQDWFNMIMVEYGKHPEWTINMYEWALKFLEVMRRKLIWDIITRGLSEKSE